MRTQNTKIRKALDAASIPNSLLAEIPLTRMQFYEAGRKTFQAKGGEGRPSSTGDEKSIARAVVKTAAPRLDHDSSGHGVSTKIVDIVSKVERQTAGTYQHSVKYYLKDPKLVHKGLLWKTLFKGINVEEWIVLEQIEDNLLKNGATFQRTLGCGILVLSAVTLSGPTKYNHHTKPLFRGLRASYRKDVPIVQGESLLDVFTNELGLKKENLESVLLRQEHYTLLKKPVADSRIGVGYKDKGSLGQGFTVEPSGEVPNSVAAEFSAVFQRWKSFISEWNL